MAGKHWIALVVGLFVGVASAAGPTELNVAQLNSVLWTQQAIEHQAATIAAYRAAGTALLTVSKQASWASLEQGAASTGRKAVVMDIDETVLDNSAYNAWLIQKGEQWSSPTWEDWVALEKAVALPGAVEFVKLAKKLKVDVFFITNRECVPRATDPCPALTHTRNNLIRLGFERAADPDALMLKKQKPEWEASDKTKRRQVVADTHKIVMLVGDDMGDFLPVANVTALRAGSPDLATARAMTQLGKRWFVIPNPMYGSWEKAVPATVAGRVSALKPPEGWAVPAPGPVPISAGSTLKVATWNMAWFANDVLTAAQAQNCREEAKAKPGLDDRPSVECRKGAPFRQFVDYERMAIHAKVLDADIVGIQEVQGLPAIQKIFDGDLAATSSNAGALIPKGTYFLAAYSQGGWQKAALAIRRSVLDPSFAPVVKEFVSLGDALPRDRRGGLEVSLKLKDGSMLTVLSVHLKSRCAEDPLDANTDHCRQLSQQAPTLAAWIAQKEVTRERYIVLGDFNRSFASPAERACSPATGDCKMHSLGAWIDGGDFSAAPVVLATAGVKHPAGCFDTRFAGDAIEHIVLGGGAETLLVPQSARTIPYVDPATGLPITDHKKAVALYSDHCAVAVEIKP
ncbi:5'-nucleotidase (lipoprotein e(P4) family) [Pelomonas saccharophila]|uniref:5'-nucleotidase (Lipoprotein e(P4) family) n=1 Tax=Roseateles saccharophilus TaxID=304 RepID=A0ABU1YMQ1_ROSSA|nr:HAD family acid phosphatase [Roseateles saccharophilus]MDR7270119.1 5'-nucleotidase (lipoprotein e(P4) family) [Roseateles saccharophilus]